MASPTVGLTVREAGTFWAMCREGQRHRVTAFRMVRRAPGGRPFRAYTRFALPGGTEVRRVRGEMYRADRLGILIRLGWTGPMTKRGA
jgi:hypothetical protein